MARNLNSHYNRLANSVQRLSSGLRINSAADDAAGLAIRELMRSDVAALNQGMRNASDAISMIQVADGALGVIDEKLIRMKELAEQAATGTYNSTQRLIIDSEFQAMASEIERIAKATDFNGIKLLDGSLQGEHDGSGLDATGKLKIHFGTNNDSAEDYYYVEIADCTLAGLGLRESQQVTTAAISFTGVSAISNGNSNTSVQASGYGNVPILSDVVTPGGNRVTVNRGNGAFSIITVGIIPAGTKDFSFISDDGGLNDTIQLFRRDGTHIAGTTLDKWRDPPASPITPADFINEANGFLAGATYKPNELNGTGSNLNPNYNNPLAPPQYFKTNDGMTIGYSGDGRDAPSPLPGVGNERLTIDETTEDLIIVIAGYELVQFEANWSYMPNTLTPPGPGPGPNPPQPDPPASSPQGDIISIKTQEKAQQALERIDDAIVIKDKVRANLGATQNRLENTVTNLTIMAENMQAAESRISDADIGIEMMIFVRNQILTQSSVAMLGQANSYPHMLSGLITG